MPTLKLKKSRRAPRPGQAAAAAPKAPLLARGRVEMEKRKEEARKGAFKIEGKLHTLGDSEDDEDMEMEMASLAAAPPPPPALSRMPVTSSSSSMAAPIAAPVLQPAAPPASDSGALRNLIRQQAARGSFPVACLVQWLLLSLSPVWGNIFFSQFCSHVWLQQAALSGAANQAAVGKALKEAGLPEKADELFITWVVCVLIEKRFADQKVNWGTHASHHAIAHSLACLLFLS